jgi:Protein of unknown function (DUF1566)/Secretion system C-terminal sorting domain
MTGLPVSGQTVSKTMKHLPDSGQTLHYSSTFGEDADYTIYPPYFINNGDGTVTDTVTGLMWQKTDGGEMTIQSAEVYVDTLTLAGYSDWRLPSANEGYSILNLGDLNPALDTNYFTNNTAQYWWTSDREVGDTSVIWVTNAGGGIGNHPMIETISAGGVKSFHARAVRNVTTPPLLPAHFIDNGDGTVTDDLTALMWQKVLVQDTITWEQALNYADTLSMAGYKDWRLPNIKELQSITDLSVSNPCMNSIFTVDTGAKFYWSSTTQFNNAPNAWYLNSLWGITTYIGKTSRLYVLCVRGNNYAEGINNVSKNDFYTAVFPNPAHNIATIRYNLTDAKSVRITIRNTAGIKVYERNIGGFKEGLNNELWEAKNMQSGIYFYSVEVFNSNNSIQYGSGKIILMN